MLNPVVKSYHTHARGEKSGWFGVGIHPALLDSDGKLVMGSEWRVDCLKAYSLPECVKVIDQLTTYQSTRRVLDGNEVCRYVHIDHKTLAETVCNVVVPIVSVGGYLPTVSHEPKSGQHRLSYPEGVLRG